MAGSRAISLARVLRFERYCRGRAYPVRAGWWRSDGPNAETPPAYAHAIAERIPGAEVAIIPQAGHLVNLEQPEAVNGALMRFLQDCEKGRAL